MRKKLAPLRRLDPDHPPPRRGRDAPARRRRDGPRAPPGSPAATIRASSSSPTRRASTRSAPGSSGREIALGGEFDVPVAVDAQGLRVQPHTAPPPPRVLAIGDSMTFGEGVTDGADLLGGARADARGARRQRRRAGLRQPADARPPAPLSPRSPPRGGGDDPLARSGTASAAPPRSSTRRGTSWAREYADRLVLLDGNLYLSETRLPVLGTATAYAERYSNLMRLAIPALAGAARGVVRSRQQEAPDPRTTSPPSAILQAARRSREPLRRPLPGGADRRPGRGVPPRPPAPRGAPPGARRSPGWPPTTSLPGATGRASATRATPTGTPPATKRWARRWRRWCGGFWALLTLTLREGLPWGSRGDSPSPRPEEPNP